MMELLLKLLMLRNYKAKCWDTWVDTTVVFEQKEDEIRSTTSTLSFFQPRCIRR